MPLRRSRPTVPVVGASGARPEGATSVLAATPKPHRRRRRIPGGLLLPPVAWKRDPLGAPLPRRGHRQVCVRVCAADGTEDALGAGVFPAHLGQSAFRASSSRRAPPHLDVAVLAESLSSCHPSCTAVPYLRGHALSPLAMRVPRPASLLPLLPAVLLLASPPGEATASSSLCPNLSDVCTVRPCRSAGRCRFAAAVQAGCGATRRTGECITDSVYLLDCLLSNEEA